MHSFFKKIIALLSGIFLLSGFSQKVVAQCTPGFLGPENVGYVLCSPTAQIDYINLFQVNASYNPILLPPNDTIKRAGQPDTIVTNQIKYMVIATLANGCKDTAIIRVPFNRDPFPPDLGRDTTIMICRGATKNIEGLYNPGQFEPIWSLPNPTVADTGRHTLRIETRDGCRDEANVTIKHFPYISFGNDTVVARRPGELVNLNTLVNTPHLTVTWNTPTPAAAPIGIYWAIGLDSNGCRDTAIAEVCGRPNLGKDTTIKVCPGLTRNLYGVYQLGSLLPEFNTNTPSSVGTGTFRLIVTNYCGGKDTVMITVVNGVKPTIGIDLEQDVCEKETVNIETLFQFVNLVPRWNIPDAEAAPAGIHRLIVTNTDGCEDTTFVTVTAFGRKPFYNDTTVFICGGQTKDLTKVYPFGEEAVVEWINIEDETTAPVGQYTVAVEDDGCRYELKVTVESEATRNAEITVCTYNTSNGFTTNDFRTVIVDKQGFVWAGANGNGSSGGLYRFTRIPNVVGCLSSGTWQAAGAPFQTTSFRDLQLSPIIGDNAIWAANAGHTAVQAIAGGVYKVNAPNNITRFGSVLDGDGTLSSRLVNSLAIAPNHLLYAAMGLSYNSNTDIYGKGDVYQYNLNTNPVGFTKPPGIYISNNFTQISAAGMRGTELWFASVRSAENSNIVNPFIQRWDSETNSSVGAVNQQNSPIPFDDNNSLIVRSIFTSSEGRTFVGLNLGIGFAVAEPADEGQTMVWTLLNDQNSAFPKGASVNSNAIAEVNGEIWMGTTQGILVYDGVGPLTDCKSYTLYNTTNGLPHNNVTDIAYDLERQEVWFTSPAGVSRVSKNFTISGQVLNVFCGKYIKGLLPKLFNRPIDKASVELLDEDDVRIDITETNAKGEFNLKNSKQGELYKVRVKFKTYTYEYFDVKANSFLGNVLLPDSLIHDLDSLKVTLSKKEFTFSFPAEQTLALLWKLPSFERAGFDTAGFANTFSDYQGIISEDHVKRIENLALYYCTLATINDIGSQATELVNVGTLMVSDIIIAMWDLKSAMDALTKFQDLWTTSSTGNTTDNYESGDIPGAINGLINKGKASLLKNLKSAVIDEFLGPRLRESLQPEGKVVYDAIKIVVDQVFSQILQTLINNEDGVANLGKEDLQKLALKYGINALAKLLTAQYYNFYCTVQHDGLVATLGTYAKTLRSEENYINVFKKTYDKGFAATGADNSINRNAIDAFDAVTLAIDAQKTTSKVFTSFAGVTQAASNLALASVVFSELAPLLRTISLALNAVSLGIQGGALLTALTGGVAIGNMSNDVVSKTGFPIVLKGEGVDPQSCLPQSTVALKQAIGNYNRALRELRVVVSGTFDTVAYYRRYNDVIITDSILTETLESTMGALWPKYNNAKAAIPGFSEDINQLAVVFSDALSGNRNAFLLENMSYVLSPNKAFNALEIVRLIDELQGATFAFTAFLDGIINELNTRCIESGAYLVNSKTNINFSGIPGTNGTVTHQFTNYGGVAQQNLSFKMSAFTGGFNLTTTDSFFVASLAPLQTVTLPFGFSSPTVDTLSDYTIKVMASNGYYTDAVGSLVTQRSSSNANPISLKAGNWNDPTLWSTGQVPTAVSSVTIKHQVTVNIDATCKTLKAESPAQVLVAAGKKLTVLD